METAGGAVRITRRLFLTVMFQSMVLPFDVGTMTLPCAIRRMPGQ